MDKFLIYLKSNDVIKTLWLLVFLGIISTFLLWDQVVLNSELVYRNRRGFTLQSKEKSGFIIVKEWFKKTSSLYEYNQQVNTVCPSEFDLIGLRGNLSADLNDTTISRVEQLIFKKRALEIRQAAHHQSLKLNLNLMKKAKDNTTQTTEEIMSSSVILINRYTYIPGGHWKPADCLPRWKVALIIPFRNRHMHLPIFLTHIIPMLQRQKLEFGIFIIEQDNNLLFNRAMLLNVGFLESLNFTKWDCFIYHDIDHIPYNDANYYGCIGMPRHFVSGVSKWGYKLSYSGFFGAVTGMTRGQMIEMNGFPNVYWGWGGEDDDIWQRVKRTGYTKTRPRSYTGWYDVIKKDHESAPHSKERVSILNHWKRRQYIDGLNSIAYEEPIITLYPLYTNIAVDIQKLNVDVDYDD